MIGEEFNIESESYSIDTIECEVTIRRKPSREELTDYNNIQGMLR